ncbi:MAG: hypothetical protein AB1297_09780, partial [bacterium]
MKKLLWLGIFAASQLFAATETITTYSDKNFKTPSSYFKDGATIYVAARVENASGGYQIGTVKSLFPPLKPWPPEANSVSNQMEIPFVDFDGDGTYSASFVIKSTDESNSLFVFDGAGVEISVDIDGVDPGKQIIIADYQAPLVGLNVSDYRFSPYTSPNSEDTTTITLSCEEAGTYRIAMEEKELKTGTIAANIPLDFVWDGYYWDKQVGASLSFEEGSHILDV